MKLTILVAHIVCATSIANHAVDTKARIREEMMGNPIRKVVTMLQKMQSTIKAEAEKEKALFEKFQCYCKNGDASLGASIAAAEAAIPETDSAIREGAAQKAQLAQELKDHQAARSEAKKTVETATTIREKAHAAFASESAELKGNIDALGAASKAIAKGMSGSFLQTTAASTVRKLALYGPSMSDSDRNDLLAFLSGRSNNGYAPQSHEIHGILEQLKEDMEKSLADITEQEEADVANHEQLMAAKTKEVNALSSSIEEKSKRIGDLAVEIAKKGHDLEDTKASLAEDQEYRADMQTQCSTKDKEWEERQAVRSEELATLAETIAALNDDDALELFKKTLPSPGLLQVQMTAQTVRQTARAALRSSPRTPQLSRWNLDFVSLALQGKRGGFDKVMKMIDDMVALLKEEQASDDSKKDYCGKELDAADDKKKKLEQSLADHETAIEDTEQGIEAAKAEINALTDGVKVLDKSVKDATEMRQKEHDEYTELMKNNGAAKDVLAWAKNRLARFYNPKLHKAPPKVNLEEASSLVQVFEHRASSRKRDGEEPEPPPETFGDYAKKTQENNGVVAMIDLLVKDLDKEMAEAEVEEKNAQKEYEQVMAASAEKRAADQKAISGKKSLEAELNVARETHKENHASTSTELMGTSEYEKSLHNECDWLLQYYSDRKEARASEADSLANAKAVLAGADFA